MAKKDTDRNEKKDSPSNKDHADKPGRGEGSDNVSSYPQNDRGNSMAGGNRSKGENWMPAGGKFKEEKGMTGAGNKSKEEQWMPEAGNSSDASWMPAAGSSSEEPLIPEISSEASSVFQRLMKGCFPKAAMLLMPFIAVGIYLVLTS